MNWPGRSKEQTRSKRQTDDERCNSNARNSISDTRTVRQAVQSAAAYLRPITDVPRLEAEVLLTYVLNISRSTLLTHPDRTLHPDQTERYRDLVARRASDYPLPYLTGKSEFYGLDFEVTPEVMIPRPETELLVELALEREPATVVDVGTGSGCIAIALATNLPAASIYAIDISPTALAVACRNVERHGVDDRVRLMVGDVLTPRPKPVDLIVSNPPYVSTNEWATLPKSVLHHEPHLALDGGADGLAIIRKLLLEAQGTLKPDGGLLIEIGAEQGEAAQQLAHTYFPQAEIDIHQDLAGRDRVLEVKT
jgi:release factor glutamine methyltransferase